MKTYIFTASFFFLSLFGVANGQGLQGGTLNSNDGSPTVSASSLVFPVVSPTCPYDQFTLNQLLGVAFSSPSTFNIGIAASSLLNQGFSANAGRLFMVGELCEI